MKKLKISTITGFILVISFVCSAIITNSKETILITTTPIDVSFVF